MLRFQPVRPAPLPLDDLNSPPQTPSPQEYHPTHPGPDVGPEQLERRPRNANDDLLYRHTGVEGSSQSGVTDIGGWF